MKKNITVLFLLVLAVCGATGAFAQSESDFTYTTEDSQVTITGYTGSAAAVVIPITIGGLPVTGIWYDAFSDRGDLSSVSIPASITQIWDGAFDGCTGLTTIRIGTNVEISYDSFDNGLYDYYDTNGKKAGVYTWSNKAWSYVAR